MKQLSREHQAIADQKAAFAQFRPAIEDAQSIELLRFYDCLDSAVSGFILSELHMRQGDRCKVLKVFPELGAHAFQLGGEYNLKALSSLANAQAFLWKFRKGLPAKGPADKSFVERLGDFRHGTREVMCQLEVKSSDAVELSDCLDRVCAVFHTGGGEGEAFGFIDDAIRRLEALRKTPGRGADTNIAAWKVLVSEILLMIAGWVSYKCFHMTCRCAQAERAVEGAVLAVASVVFVA